MKRFPILLILLISFSSSAFAGWDEGLAAFKAGRFDEAIREFKSVADAQPDWPGSYLMMGQSYLKLKRSSEAVNAIKKAYDLDPGDDSTKLALGQAYVEASKYSDASRLLKTIDVGKLKSSKQGAYHQLLAVAMSNSGQSAQALSALKKAAAASPNDAKLHYNLGRSALVASDTTVAISALKKAVSLDGNDSKKKEYLVKAYILKGRQAAKGSSTKATAYNDAVQIAKVLARSGSFEHLLTLGEAQLGAKAYSDAVGSFDKAAAKKSSDWLSQYYKGQAQTSLKNYGQAEKSLNSSLGKTESSQNKKKIYSQLAFVYEKQKKFDKAISTYNRVGDAGGAARVQKNKDTASENDDIDAANLEIKALEAAKAALDAEIEGLEPD